MIEVLVVVREQVLAVDEGVCNGDALGEDRGLVIIVGVRGAVLRASRVGAYGGVPVICAIARVLPVDGECRLLWDCGRYEDDAAVGRPPEEDYLGCGSEWGECRRVKTVDGEAEGGAFGKDSEAAVGSNRLGV